MMDRLEEIRIKNCAFLTHGEKDWLVSEIERLRNGIQLALDKFAKRHRESGLEILQETLKEKT